MFQYHEVPGTNILEFVIDGKITADEVQEMVPKFVAAAERHKTLKILKEVRNVEGIDPAIFGKQIGEVFAHLGEITHAALVADPKWKSTVETMGPVYPFQVRFFELSQIDEARQWLRAAV